MTKPWQERVSEEAEKHRKGVENIDGEIGKVSPLIAFHKFIAGANFARAETLREMEKVIEAAKEIQKVYGNDSNGIHQKLYKALATFDRIKQESDKV